MQLNQRVRAILVKNPNTLLLIKRVRPGLEPYWVLPGGGIEQTDTSPEAALDREVREEMSATINIYRLVYVLERQEESKVTRELFFLCKVIDYDFDSRSGPEFSDPARGEYILEEIELTEGVLQKTNIKPHEFKQFLVGSLNIQISISGPDNIGKTTQIRLLKTSLKDECFSTGGLHLYHGAWPELPPKDFSKWWFSESTTEELTQLIFALMQVEALS
jgi:ADP-ribose pyrophosphatase YjhB (NUDIX family)